MLQANLTIDDIVCQGLNQIKINAKADKKLTAHAYRVLEKIILFQTKGKGKTFATNSYLARELMVSERSISRYVKSLAELGYIRSIVEKGKRILFAVLDKFDNCIKEQRKSNQPILKASKSTNMNRAGRPPCPEKQAKDLSIREEGGVHNTGRQFVYHNRKIINNKYTTYQDLSKVEAKSSVVSGESFFNKTKEKIVRIFTGERKDVEIETIRKNRIVELKGAIMENKALLAKHGFEEHHYMQLEALTAKRNIEPSLKYFLFDLEHNDKAKTINTTPPAFFLAIIRKRGYYEPPHNYVDKAAIERRRAQVAKRREEMSLAGKRVSDRQRALDEEFAKWLSSLPDDERGRIAARGLPMGRIKIKLPDSAVLRAHFDLSVSKGGFA